MKKLISILIFTTLFTTSAIGFSATLQSLTQTQMEQAFVGKTAVSIGTDNLNGKTISNTFSMYMDPKGHIWGKMSQKPAHEPQTDTGTYSIDPDGSFHITWQHWDGAKELTGYVFVTENAYLSVDNNNVFHTVFMKAQIVSGKHL